MHGGHDARREVARLDLTTVLGQAELRTEQRLSGRSAKRDDEVRSHAIDFCSEPRPARLNFEDLRLGVNSPFAAHDEFEVLNGIRDVDHPRVDTRLLHRIVQDAPGRTDERMALAIFGVAWLFADEHQRR